jgi:methyltransferase (TIGR00027 family)
VTEASPANPVSITAYWTLAARYADATGPRPIANDTYAARFTDDDARAVAERFSALKRPFQSFPIRHRMIDDMLREELGRDRGARITVIGCGFDTRPYRLDGGRWVEVDEPELLAIKEARLPAAEAPSPVERIPIRFREESLEATLMPYATDERVVIVLEGILGYIPDPDRRAFLATLVRLFPHHAVVCDLLTRTFLARYARSLVRFLREIDAEFAASSDHPEALFHELGYRTAARVSVPERAAELGAQGAPPRWLVRLLPGFRNGYCVWKLEHGK